MTRDNNFDFLRFFAATLVIIEHSYALLGQHTYFRHITGIGLGGIATDIFFIISGYLISASWHRSPHVSQYLRKRVLRIFPALILSTFVSVLIIGSITTSLPLVTYFTASDTYYFLTNALMIGAYTQLPGVFADTPYTDIVNGSLWTLRVEMLLYLMVMLFGLVKWRPVILFTILLMVFLVIFITIGIPEKLSGQHTTILWGVSLYHASLKCAFFMIGALIFHCFDIMRFHRLYFMLAVLVTALIPLSGLLLLVKLALFITLPYIVLTFAFSPAPFQHFGKYGDFSYGMYVLAFPIQQLMISVFALTSPLVVFATSLPVIMITAYGSWHLVEKRALMWK